MKIKLPNFSAREKTKARAYRSDRMGKIRGEVMHWLCEYEEAPTAKHREACMDMITMNLKKYEWYGNR